MGESIDPQIHISTAVIIYHNRVAQDRVAQVKLILLYPKIMCKGYTIQLFFYFLCVYLFGDVLSCKIENKNNISKIKLFYSMLILMRCGLGVWLPGVLIGFALGRVPPVAFTPAPAIKRKKTIHNCLPPEDRPAPP